jgi:hypothetical protein
VNRERLNPVTGNAASQSWQISPSLAGIQEVMREIRAKKTVLAIYFRNPYVLDDELKEAGAILASFGGSDVALLESSVDSSSRGASCLSHWRTTCAR